MTTSTGTFDDPLDSWEAWWQHNRDAFLDLKATHPDADSASGSPGQLTGRGRHGPRTRVQRPTTELIDLTVVPALLGLIEQHKQREILNPASLAVGRVAGPDRGADVVEHLVTLLGHSERQVQASAALGLGALGRASGEQQLLALLRDDSAGRGLAGGRPVDSLVRSVAALSLGLRGDARSIWSLMDLVQRLPDSERDVKASVIAALGLLPADHPRTQVARPILIDMLDDQHLDPFVASVIPTTLGKMGAREALPALVKLLGDRDADLLLRQSSAIALGLLGTLEDESIVEALVEQVDSGRDRATRHFALIALGRIGAIGAGTPAAQRALSRLLRREIAGSGAHREHRSWAALAGSIFGRGVPAAQPALAEALREAHDDEHDPMFKAAFALALGLLSDRESAPRLLADLETSEDALAGYGAVALGLLDQRDAAGPIRALLSRKGASPQLRSHAATGLALLKDRDSVAVLIDLLVSDASYDEQAAVSQALGLIGEVRSVSPLLQLATDEGARLRDRGFACLALGLLGERTRLPFHTRLRSDTNYLARIEPLVQVAQIL